MGLDWFVWDSFPMLAGSNTRDGIDDICLDIKNAIRGKCYGLMVAHLNERGQIKGNNHIRYIVDCIYYMMLERLLGEGIFSLVSGKSRQGARGAKAFGKHNNGGINVLPTEYYLDLEKLMKPTKKKK